MSHSSTKTETPEQALERIQSLGFGKNDAIVIMAFADRGIPAEDIDPRNNVLTFRAWKAKGRSVAKGAISVRVTTWIPCKEKDAGKDGKRKEFMRPKTAFLFHVSQTNPKGAPKGTRPDAWQNPALVRERTYDNIDSESVGSAGVHRYVKAEPKPEIDAAPVATCTCPAVGLVANVDCPSHGRERLERSLATS